MIFQGDTQVLNKLKTILAMLRDDPCFGPEIREILRAASLAHFTILATRLVDFKNKPAKF
jgi:hypothetical protein